MEAAFACGESESDAPLTSHTCAVGRSHACGCISGASPAGGSSTHSGAGSFGSAAWLRRGLGLGFGLGPGSWLGLGLEFWSG